MRLATQRWGPESAPVVVCLHGVMGHAGRFRRTTETFLPDRHVVALDLRGHGHSGWEPPWNIETFVDDICETLDALDVGRADVVGFSFGGRLALELAATNRDRVHRLVLLDPAIRLTSRAALAMADQAREEVTFADVDAAVTARLASLAHTPPEMIAADVAESLEPAPGGGFRYRAARSAVVAAYGEMARAPRLPTDVPTLLVRAAAGIVDDDQEALLRQALGDHLTVTVVPGNHPVMWDAFDQTGAALTRHLTPA